MPVINMDDVNFFQPQKAWTVPHSSSPIRHGNTKSGDSFSAQTNRRFGVDYRNGPSISPGDRDEVEDELPPADQLRLVSSSPDMLMDGAGPRPSTWRTSASSTTSQNCRSTPDDPIVIEDDSDASDDDNGNGNSTSAVTLSRSTTSSELTTSADVLRENMGVEISAPSNLSMVLSSLSGHILPEQAATLDEDSSEESQDDASPIHGAQSLLSSPSGHGEPSSPPTEMSQCATEEAFQAELLSGNQELTIPGRDEALTCATDNQVSNVSVNSVNSVEMEVCQEKDLRTESSHISDEDESDDEDPQPPVKRRRTRLTSSAVVSTSPTRSCSSPRFRLRRRRQTPQSRGSSCGTVPTDNRPTAEPQCPSRRDVASVPFADASDDLEQMTHAEFKELSFQGVAKCITIGGERMFHLEFSLPGVSGDVSLPMSSIDHGSPKSGSGPNRRRRVSKISYPGSRSPGDKWTPEEDEMVRSMKRDGCSWAQIHSALPHRSKGTIQVRYSTKLKA
ncbi:hypothetical protein CEP54_016148 [Fusarium duplospermum]|uniref:Myb-like domain-containing protein n=1 Tax=Fusarium duplospermum TaxID=1325734 RepID=A0A428NHR0_9HYPO|nr:hypothetical protein CEP54_016148 [Fusarium duplospermum]